MNIVFGLIAAAFIAFIGLLQLITGRVSGDQSKYKEYTPESMVKMARVSGFFFLLTGVFLALQDLVSQDYIPGVPRYLFIIFTVVCAVSSVVFSLTMPRKKDAGASVSQTPKDEEEFRDED